MGGFIRELDNRSIYKVNDQVVDRIIKIKY